jgi:hypothetical protein
MKKYLLILTILFAGFNTLHAQPPLPHPPPPDDRIHEKMIQFIQKRMELKKEERERFRPLFMRYQQEWRRTLQENREDRLMAKQRLIDLQLRYRKDFGDIVGDKRVIEVYDLQERFIQILRDVQRERREGPPPPPNRRRGMRFI